MLHTHSPACLSTNNMLCILQGDILPTAAGGTSVVFRDVEVIKQKSPGDRSVSQSQLSTDLFSVQFH